MQVTKQNFEDALSRFSSLLPSCEFVAFDEEMTGIMLADCAPNAADTPEARYAKMKRVVHEFSLMQVGLCLFHREGRQLVASPFNFFVFPDAKAGGRLVMYASTAAFHRENNMDFNLWIREGVPYLTRERHAAEMAEANAPRAPAEGRQSLVLTREDDLRFMAAAVEAIGAWLGADEPELRLPACNAFMRRALYERVALDYPEIELESRDFADPTRAGQMNKHIVAMRLTADEKAARDERLRQARLDQVKARSGFFRLWEALTAAKKPVVGHNCLYDLLFLYSHFEAPLPDTMAEFKAKLTALLPEIWDTKYVSTKRGFSETALGKLYNECVSQMKLPVTFAAGHDAYAQGGQCHDAGYDAYMTGVIFGSLAPGKEDRNKLYMMRSLFTLCIGGDDDLNQDGACFHLTFDAACSTADLINALHPDASKGGAADGSAPPLTIQWINNTQAFALVREAKLEQEAIARASLAGMQAVTLAEWLKQQGAGKEQAPAESRTCAEASAAVQASAPAEEKKKRGVTAEASAAVQASAPAKEKKKRGAAAEASVPEASAPAEKKKRGVTAEASVPEASAPAEKKKRGAAAEAAAEASAEASAPAKEKKRGTEAEAFVPEASAPAEKKKRGAAAEASAAKPSAPAEKKKRGAAAEASAANASAPAEEKKRGAAAEASVPEASAPAEKKKRGAAAEVSAVEASAPADKKKRGGKEAEASVPEASAPAEKTRRNRQTQDIPVKNAPAPVESATASRAARSSARRVASK